MITVSSLFTSAREADMTNGCVPRNRRDDRLRWQPHNPKKRERERRLPAKLAELRDEEPTEGYDD